MRKFQLSMPWSFNSWRRNRVANLIAILTWIAVSAPLLAQQNGTTRPEMLQEVGLDQKLNEQVPLDLEFTDASGQPVQLGDFFGEKPVILTLVYYDCPMLCTLVLNGTLRTLRALNFTAGKEFEIVTVSIDPSEGPGLAAQKKQEYVSSYRRAEARNGWHFLTGREDQIRVLADAVGFRYVYDPDTGEFAHASGIMVLTPQGRVARYFYGVEYAPRDVRLGLIEAASGKIGNPIDQVLLFCYHYDPSVGKYTMAVMNVVRVGGLLTLAGIGALLFFMLRREKTEPTAGSVSKTTS